MKNACILQEHLNKASVEVASSTNALVRCCTRSLLHYITTASSGVGEKRQPSTLLLLDPGTRKEFLLRVSLPMFAEPQCVICKVPAMATHALPRRLPHSSCSFTWTIQCGNKEVRRLFGRYPFPWTVVWF